jgi:hypothetical protein
VDNPQAYECKQAPEAGKRLFKFTSYIKPTTVFLSKLALSTSEHRARADKRDYFMAGLSFDVLRVGKRYRLVNFGDRYEFEIERILVNGDFKVKDIHTLERFNLKDVIKFGQGKDFVIEEI